MSKNIYIILIASLLISTSAFGSLLLNEDFSYPVGTSLNGTNGWAAHSGVGTNPIKIVSPGLTYVGYVSSGIGNTARLISNGEDDNKTFTSQTSGTIYAAFMVNFDTVKTGADYFFHISLFAQALQVGRIYAKKDPSSAAFAFGLSKYNEAATYTGYTYAVGTTYLVILKYEIVSGVTNDIVSLFVYPAGVPTTEPAPTLGPSSPVNTDPADIGSVELRQGSGASASAEFVDGIRIGTSWSDVFFPPANPAPTISNISKTPSIPLVGQTVTVAVKIYDDSTSLGNIADTLFYAVNTQTTWNTVLKTGYNASDSVFSYTISPTKSIVTGDTVFYKVFAADTNGNSTTSSVARYTIPLEKTISAIQGTGAISPELNNYVHTRGIVTGAFPGTSKKVFYIEERPGSAWHGLYVYRPVGEGTPTVNIGDSVSIIGTVAEYNTVTELDASASKPGKVEVIGSGLQLPDTTVLTISGVIENYEGCLVRVDNLHFNVTGSFAAGTYWAVNNPGTESLRVRIDNGSSGIIGQTIPGGMIAIIGNLNAYKDTFELWPRALNDFIPAPPPPFLVSPYNGSATNDMTPTFIWDTVSGVIKYNLFVEGGAKTVVVNETITGTANYTPVTNIAEGMYTWKVKSFNTTGGWGDYAPALTFTIDTTGPVAPILIAPANDTTVNTQTPTFEWNKVSDAVMYNLVVSTAKTEVINIETDDSVFTPIANLDTGAYTWSVRAKDAVENWGGFSPSWTFTIAVAPTPPPLPPVLLTPSNDTIFNERQPTFSWDAVSGASQFNLVVTLSANDSIVIDQTTSDLNYTPEESMPEGVYTWKVKSFSTTGGWGDFSSAWTFTIDTTPPGVPILVSPVNGTHSDNRRPTFNWNYVTDALAYQFIVLDSLNAPVIDTITMLSYYNVTIPLPVNYYSWKVRARDAAGNWGDFSSTWILYIGPIRPTLIAPADNSITNNQRPTFEWENLSGAALYQLSAFINGHPDAINETLNTNTFTPINPLDEGWYHWNVRARDSFGDWGLGTFWEFTIDTTPLPPPVPESIRWHPINGGVIRDTLPLFSWARVSGGFMYNLVVTKPGKAVVIDIETPETTYATTTSLGEGSYSWSLRVKDSAGNWSGFSSPPYTFTIVLGTPGWVSKESMPSMISGKYVADGGSLVKVGGTKDGDDIYGFRGKSREFYKYTPGTPGTWTRLESIPNGKKVTDPTKINKKVVAKGASMCYDGSNIIYATKGNGVPEFWAYYIDTVFGPAGETIVGWKAKAFVPVPKSLKGGTSIRYYDGKVYLLAGNQKKTDLNNFFVYDPTADTTAGTPWTALASLPVLSGTKQVVWKDGSSIIELGGTFYALKANIKPNRFFSYDMVGNAWTELTADTIPPFEYLLKEGVGKLKKVYLKDGAATATDGVSIYATKGGSYNFMWKYTPGIGWTEVDSVPRLHKKSVIKTGGALTYANGALWLLKGNKSPEYWKYIPSASVVASVTPRTTASVMIEHTTATNFTFDATPNPFTTLTTIRYTVPVAGKVSVKLYNAMGNVVETVTNEYLNAGNYTIRLSANTLAKGVYFLKYSDATNSSELKLIVQ